MATVRIRDQYSLILEREGIALSYWLGAERTAYRVVDLFSVRTGPLSLSLPRSSRWLPGSRVCHVRVGVRRGRP